MRSKMAELNEDEEAFPVLLRRVKSEPDEDIITDRSLDEVDYQFSQSFNSQESEADLDYIITNEDGEELYEFQSPVTYVTPSKPTARKRKRKKPVSPAKRRQRCGMCGPCQVKSNCGECGNCLRRSVLKQSCIYRKCLYLRKAKNPLQTIEPVSHSVQPEQEEHTGSYVDDTGLMADDTAMLENPMVLLSPDSRGTPEQTNLEPNETPLLESQDSVDGVLTSDPADLSSTTENSTQHMDNSFQQTKDINSVKSCDQIKNSHCDSAMESTSPPQGESDSDDKGVQSKDFFMNTILNQDSEEKFDKDLISDVPVQPRPSSGPDNMLHGPYFGPDVPLQRFPLGPKILLQRPYFGPDMQFENSQNFSVQREILRRKIMERSLSQENPQVSNVVDWKKGYETGGPLLPSWKAFGSYDRSEERHVIKGILENASRRKSNKPKRLCKFSPDSEIEADVNAKKRRHSHSPSNQSEGSYSHSNRPTPHAQFRDSPSPSIQPEWRYINAHSNRRTPQPQFPGADPNRVGPQPQFPGADPNRVGPQPQFPGADPNRVGPQPQFPGADPNRVGPQPQFPGADPNRVCPQPQFPGADPNRVCPQPQFPGADPNRVGPQPQFPGADPNRVGPQPQFPGADPNRVCPQPQFPGADPNRVGPQPQFPGADSNRVGPQQQFPGAENQRFPYPMFDKIPPWQPLQDYNMHHRNFDPRMLYRHPPPQSFYMGRFPQYPNQMTNHIGMIRGPAPPPSNCNDKWTPPIRSEKCESVSEDGSHHQRSSLHRENTPPFSKDKCNVPPDDPPRSQKNLFHNPFQNFTKDMNFAGYGRLPDKHISPGHEGFSPEMDMYRFQNPHFMASSENRLEHYPFSPYQAPRMFSPWMPHGIPMNGTRPYPGSYPPFQPRIPNCVSDRPVTRPPPPLRIPNFRPRSQTSNGSTGQTPTMPELERGAESPRNSKHSCEDLTSSVKGDKRPPMDAHLKRYLDDVYQNQKCFPARPPSELSKSNESPKLDSTESRFEQEMISIDDFHVSAYIRADGANSVEIEFDQSSIIGDHSSIGDPHIESQSSAESSPMFRRRRFSEHSINNQKQSADSAKIEPVCREMVINGSSFKIGLKGTVKGTVNIQQELGDGFIVQLEIPGDDLIVENALLDSKLMFSSSNIQELIQFVKGEQKC